MTDSRLSILVAHRAGQSGADLERALMSFGCTVTMVADIVSVRKCLAQSSYTILMLESDLLPPNPTSVLSEIVAWQVDLAVVVMAGTPSMKSVVAALRGGACDYLAKPYGLDQLDQCIQRAIIAHERFSRRLQNEAADAVPSTVECCSKNS